MTVDFERSCVRSYVDHRKLMDLKEDLALNADMDRKAEMLAMLGNATRLKILYVLSKGEELCVCDLADILEMDVSAISHQLRRLRDRGLVRNRRDGMTIYYRVEQSSGMVELCQFVEMMFGLSTETELVYEG